MEIMCAVTGSASLSQKRKSEALHLQFKQYTSSTDAPFVSHGYNYLFARRLLINKYNKRH
jgi:hypothetical protein